MSIKTYFPTYIDHSPNFLKPAFNLELKKEIQQIRKIDVHGEKWSAQNYFAGYTSYASMDRLHLSSPNFAILELHLAHKIQKFIKVLEWDVHPKNIKMNSCWVNIMPRGAHHTSHIHPHSILSGTYYVDIPNSSSPIQFEDPRHSRMMLAPQKKLNCKDIHKSFVTIQTKARDLILFESWLRHSVPVNRVSKERISVSFNYSLVE